MNVLKSTLAVVALAAAASFYFALPWLFPASQQLTLAELESKYATPESRFADLGGVRTHYRDEGEGPVVMLVHASFMNLRSWDPVVEKLKATHRVIRLDLLVSGLTGVEPNDAYSFDRNVELVRQLVDYLELDRFALVGTSSGGIVAFNFAARFPERVERLVLVNSAGMPRTASTNPNRQRGSALQTWMWQRYKSKDRVRADLNLNFIEPNEPPEWLVDINYHMGLREGLQREGGLLLRNFRTGDPQSVLAGVIAPTLVLWGIENQTVSHLEADVFASWLTAAPTAIKKYDDVGHYLYVEMPELFTSDLQAFLAGEMDEQLRYTRREGFLKR